MEHVRQPGSAIELQHLLDEENPVAHHEGHFYSDLTAIAAESFRCCTRAIKGTALLGVILGVLYLASLVLSGPFVWRFSENINAFDFLVTGPAFAAPYILLALCIIWCIADPCCQNNENRKIPTPSQILDP